jgi:hypothetical protein
MEGKYLFAHGDTVNPLNVQKVAAQWTELCFLVGRSLV